MSHQRTRPLERYQVSDLLTGTCSWTDVSIAERREAVRLLTEAGQSAPEIAVRLGVTHRTVTRARYALRQGTRTAAEPPRPLHLDPYFHVFVPAHVRPLIGLP